MTTEATAPITVPHGEGGSTVEDAEWTIAEAMRLTSSPGAGRITFGRGAKHAVASMLAAGWTPPAQRGQGDDESARLRGLLADMQARLDELGGHLIRMQISEMAADNAFHGMSASAAVQTVRLREQRSIALKAADGVEPTLTLKQVADGLEKLANLGKTTHKRIEDQQAKERAAITNKQAGARP